MSRTGSRMVRWGGYRGKRIYSTTGPHIYFAAAVRERYFAKGGIVSARKVMGKWNLNFFFSRLVRRFSLGVRCGHRTFGLVWSGMPDIG